VTFDHLRDAQGRIDPRRFFDEHWGAEPFHRKIGLEFVEADAEAGTAVLRLPFRPDHLNSTEPAGAGIHGGIIATLIDATAPFALVIRTGNIELATANMRVDYLAWTGHATLTAFGRVLRIGRTISVTDCRVEDDRGRLCAVGRVTFAALASRKTG
jgi:uncharacterized protein (TIGR00369 family)